jgi:hypothetical protein
LAHLIRVANINDKRFPILVESPRCLLRVNGLYLRLSFINHLHECLAHVTSSFDNDVEGRLRPGSYKVKRRALGALTSIAALGYLQLGPG